MLVRRGGDRLLFDCGEGTQRQLLRSSVGLVDLEEIFVTHLHADHYLGLPGMLKTFSLRMREVPLTVYGPPGLRELFDALGRVFGQAHLPASSSSRSGPATRSPHDGYEICVFPVDHGVPAVGYALVEDERPGPLRRRDGRRARRPVRPRARRAPARRGGHARRRPRRCSPSDLVGEPRRGRTIVYTGDTAPAEAVAAAVPGRRPADPRGDVRARTTATAPPRRGHSTAREAAEVARDAGVVAARAHARLAALPRLRAPPGGARGVSGHGPAARLRRRRGAVSASAGEPVLVKGGAHPERRARGGRRPVTETASAVRRPRRALRGAAPGRRELVGGLRRARPARRAARRARPRGRLRHRPALRGARAARARPRLGGRRLRRRWSSARRRSASTPGSRAPRRSRSRRAGSTRS